MATPTAPVRILSVLLENEPGALSRVVGLFSQRGYNIDSLNVAPTEDRSLSRLTLTTACDDAVVEQITKQLNKLVDVVKVQDISEGPHIERELMLIKIRARSPESRTEVARCVQIFRGQIIDVAPSYYTCLLVGDGTKLDAFIAALGDIRVLEVVRSGLSGIARSEKAMSL
ncbi:MAG: acetolactate synthase small subunit [Cellvibrionales bacterium]|nr:acetolactate synthase small subunit [Cellvibrionales bacterium]